VLVRHQLNVLRRRIHSKPRLTVADRLIFVWLYGLFPAVLNAILGDGRLRDLDPELQQFAVDARRAPQRVRLAHFANEGTQVS
jgi:hypothetical protein